ncbi:MAG: PEP-utilizing enzyme [Flavobacteriales bacterium]|nr:PEP-utilizing enzyme [Flavobacteriales bacterium]
MGSQAPKTDIGGKAWHLQQMKDAGLPVPDFMVIAADDFLNPETLDAKIQEVQTHFQGTSWLAVRSSAADEDGSDHSFAGLFETLLFVAPNDLKEAIQKVHRSANSERINTYLKEKGITQGMRMAVIIQEMIDARSAGVAFGIDPVSGEEHTVINAVYGVGEGLVSGALNADSFVVNNGDVKAQLTQKTHAFKLDHENGGVIEQAVDAPLQEAASISDQEVQDIANQTAKLEALFGSPQDVEWAIANAQLYILQSRPITGVRKRDRTKMIVWDNSNIIESYPGLSSPLTFSFIKKMYSAVYREMSLIMGVTAKEIDANAFVFDNMLGLLKGRVYYNLLSWYKALALLPGYDLNAEFMERMMGVKERFELQGHVQTSKWKAYLRVARLGVIMLRNYRRLPRERKAFQTHFQRVLSSYHALPLDELSDTALMHHYLAFEERLTKNWQAPLVNDFFAMIFFGVTQKLTEKYELPEGIHNDLLSGSNDIISTEHVKRSMEIIQAMDDFPELPKHFASLPAEEGMEHLEKYPKIKALVNDFLRDFGDRTVGELKLETITLKQAPEKYIRILQNYLRSQVDPTDQLVHGERLRKEAEKKLALALKGKWWKRKVYRYFLKRARTLVSERENLRFERTRGFGKVRELFLAIGKRWEEQGHLHEQRDIFYLKMEEVFDFINGTGHSPELKVLIDQRKRDYEVYDSLYLPERIVTYGAVHENQLSQSPPVIAEEGDLQGIGCCPGVVKARVQVIHDPSEVDSLNGDILVTSSTDPGWITLFPGASAIIVERGSLLSHSAIVSREMGKPCIVAVTGLLNTLKTGDMVEMDGSTGVIKRIQ